MREGPEIATVAALIGDPARANMLVALLRVPALTAGELAEEGGITPQTASAHLRRLQDGGLLRLIPQGRHRYYALADDEVANHLEQMLGLATHLGHVRTRPGPRDPALRRARLCYDHMAGELAVNLLDRLRTLGGLEESGNGLALTQPGLDALRNFGVTLSLPPSPTRRFCRSCLDWSERRFHISGQVGTALLDRLITLDWVRRRSQSRALLVTGVGEAGFPSLFR